MAFKVRLVLVGVEGPVNLGFIARLAANFDVDEFYLVAPQASVEEALEYAAKARRLLEEARIVNTLEEALEGVDYSACTSAIISRGDDVLRSPITPWELAEVASRRGGKLAVVFGRESTGLTRGELGMCDLLVSIPASESYRTLNLSNAVAIILYELFKARGAPPHERIPAEPRVLRLIEDYVDRLSRIIARDPLKAREVHVAFRRVMERCMPSKEEADKTLFLVSRLYSLLERCSHLGRS